MKVVLTLLVILAFATTAWFGYNQYQSKAILETEIASLKQQITELKSEVETLQTEVGELEQQSLDTMVDNANKKLKDGLKSMFKAAEDEFQRLQEIIDDSFEESNPQTTPKPDQPKPTHKT